MSLKLLLSGGSLNNKNENENADEVAVKEEKRKENKNKHIKVDEISETINKAGDDGSFSAVLFVIFFMFTAFGGFMFCHLSGPHIKHKAKTSC